ncbi:MAG: hypothetical protein WD534_15120 [Phycisphaeraceae bacterium]
MPDRQHTASDITDRSVATDPAACAADSSTEPRSTPLRVLVRRVVEHADSEALSQLHCRRICRPCPRPMTIVNYLDLLRERMVQDTRNPGSTFTADRAYDLTLDRFFRLPADRGPAHANGRGGVDCRLYWKAFLQHRTTQSTDPLRAEVADETALTAFVSHHFRLSWREAARQANAAVSRYAWQVNGHHLRLRMPAAMDGASRRRWLEQQVPDVDPTRPGEQHRIQQIIDRKLGRSQQLSLEGKAGDATAVRCEAYLPWPLEHGLTVHGLADTVAAEKSARIDELRPSIRQLGEDRLRALVREIFQQLGDETYHPASVARAFGMSKAAMSRFAGLRWTGASESAAPRIPDLWANTAQVLAEYRPFREAAESVGIWQEVRRTLDRTAKPSTE